MRDDRFQIGEHWLSNKPNSPYFHATWFEKQTRQTCRVSLGTVDFQTAQIKLAQFVTLNAEMKSEKVKDVLLGTVLQRYWSSHGIKLPSRAQAKIALGYETEFFGAITVAELTKARQAAFLEWLTGKGFKNSYKSRFFTVGRAALNWAWKHHEIESVPFIFDDLDHSDEKEAKRLEPDEMRLLLEATLRLPHLHDFCMISLNTLARPRAVFDLALEQVHHSEGYIDLNPKGHLQTKKFHPI